ncbi:MAG: carboxymuconolactone decarboxylase family protein [Deinococcales bacterium]
MSNSETSCREKIWGQKADRIEAGLYQLDEDLAKLIIDVAYENVFAREGLDLKTRELLAIMALMTVGTESEIKTHIYGALNCGASLTEIKETIIQGAVYLGFPRSLVAMKALSDVRARLAPEV